MLKSRILVLLLVAVLSIGWFSTTGIWKRSKTKWLGTSTENYVLDNHLVKKMEEKGNAAKAFAKQNKYNESLCFLIDMSLPSGQNRFFVYDMNHDSLQSSGLVTHGRCNQYWLDGRKYGNTVGCGCTSLGKYKVGYSYNGKFGLAFKLYGLEKTNDKAFARFVVLHSHSCVPETEVADEISQSDGCPTVSPGFLQKLKAIIKSSSKPILLWIYE